MTSNLIPLDPAGIPGAFLLSNFLISEDQTHILSGVNIIASMSRFRKMVTPQGHPMSVEMTNAGLAGWVSDLAGYRYENKDPLTGVAWPHMPLRFRALAERAAKEAGFPWFQPDVCLINRYSPGAKLTLHQDKDEIDYTQPIVSFSLGLTAVFQLGGMKRSEPIQGVKLQHGDAVVLGGESRLRYHGILPLRDGEHPEVGRYRINLTFRKAL